MSNIALIGFGEVGKSFIKLLQIKKDLLPKNTKLKYVIKRDGGIYNKDGLDIDEIIKYTSSNNKIQNHPLWSDISFENKINVVTGNKGPILLYYNELKNLALKNNVELKIGCTTGGALPSVNVGTKDVLGAQVTEIIGVLNGTTNFILEEMLKNKVEYKDALKKAQDLNIAEKDPSLDVLGIDTGIKMAILSKVIWDVDFEFDKLDIKGITDIKLNDLLLDNFSGKKTKLIGRAFYLNGNFEFEVKPISIDKYHPLYFVDGKNKGVHYKTDILGDITVIGGASSPLNAAAAILRDLLNITK